MKLRTVLLVTHFACSVGSSLLTIALTMSYGTTGLLMGLVLSIFLPLVVPKLISHPLLRAFQGQLLVMSIDSTGIIKLYNAKVVPPKVFIKDKEHLFNRDTLTTIEYGGEATVEKEEDKIIIEKKKLRDTLFMIDGIPCILYNDCLGTLISKTAIKGMEDDIRKTIALEVLYKVDELERKIRDFGRSVVDLLKPITATLQNPFVVILITIIIGALILMFLGNIPAALPTSVKVTPIVQPTTPKP